MKKLLSLTLCLFLLLGLAACGANSSVSRKAESPAAMNTVMSAGAPMEEAAMDSAVSGSSGDLSSTVLPENRKWIITVYMDAETENLDDAVSGIDTQIQEMGGYVEDQRIYNGSSYSSSRYRSANLTIRVPAEKVDAFSEAVSGLSNVVSKEKNLEDITLTYTATENRIKALEAEQTRLLELLAEADNMSDLLEIEARLTDVRYELESYTSQMRVYNNQIDFATIYLNLSEVQEYTPVEEPTFFERIRDTFSDALEGLGNGIVDLTIFLVGNSPYLLVYSLLGAGIFLLVRRIRKALLGRKAKENKQD